MPSPQKSLSAKELSAKRVVRKEVVCKRAVRKKLSARELSAKKLSAIFVVLPKVSVMVRFLNYESVGLCWANLVLTSWFISWPLPLLLKF